MKKIAIFASGSGSNTQKIIEYFCNSQSIEVAVILSNNPDAFVLHRADNFEIPTIVFTKEEFYNTQNITNKLLKLNVDLIVLAGFLLLVPPSLLNIFSKKIINIHPALLPKFGGKGMYGMNVHKAVIQAKEKVTGITIHYLNEEYDKGEIIFQAKCRINETDSPESIAFKVSQLEHKFYPKIIEKVLTD